MKTSIIITSYKEPKTIKKAIKHVVIPTEIMWKSLEFIITAPDTKTIQSAKQTFNDILKNSDTSNAKRLTAQTQVTKVNKNTISYKIIKDNATGKPNALNMAINQAIGKILILTDGDMYVSDNAIRLLLKHFGDEKVGGVSGHPVSQDTRITQFGYYGHLFCDAAHHKRLSDPTTPMSGYLYAIRNDKRLWPLPTEIRAEDAYISLKLLELGYKLKYEPNALAYVKFPKTMNDWVLQKTRSLGGNVQLKHIQTNAKLPQPKQNKSDRIPHKKQTRTITEDLKMAYFPIKFAKTPKELWYSLILYPLRLYLWIRIFIQDKTKTYSKGVWKRVDSTK